MLQQNIQQQVTALIRTYLTENRPISKEAVTVYLRDVAGMAAVTEGEVEQALLSLFARNEEVILLHTLSISQAFLFSPLVYGAHDEDYAFVVVRSWASHTLCYATYAVTRDRSLLPRLILICTKDNTVLEQLCSLKLCPSEWLPLSAERGLAMIQKSMEDVTRSLTAKVAELRESGPLRVAE